MPAADCHLLSRTVTSSLLILLLASPLLAETSARPTADLVQATLLADVDAAVPGRSFTLGVQLKMKEPWHTYWVNPGESGEPTRIQITGPEGFNFGAIQWPIPKVIPAPGGIAYGYDDEVLLMIPVTVAKHVPPNGKATLNANVSWLSCNKTCIEGGAKLLIDLPVRGEAKAMNAESFAASKQRLPVAKDQPPAVGVLSGVEQPAGTDGSPLAEFTVHWKQPPAKVEWFPISTRAVAVEDVVVKHDGASTHIAYKPTVYKPDQIPDGRVEGVLVYEDASGRRFGVTASIRIAKTG